MRLFESLSKLLRTFPATPGLPASEQESGQGRYKPDVLVAIGEDVQLQSGRKEPPFSIAVLGPPEIVDETTMRVPTRITSIISRWTCDTYSSCLAFLYHGPDYTSEHNWTNVDSDNDPYRGVNLVKGGSHEGFIYFRDDSGVPDATIPEQPFTELHYLDETEELIVVDLARAVPVPERIRFEGGDIGTLWNNPPSPGVGKRLSGSFWDFRAAPPRVGIGDTVTVPNFGDYPKPNVSDPMMELTVLGQPETFDERTVRLRLRVAPLLEEGQPYRLMSYPPLTLSTAPDTHGRLHHAWEAVTDSSADDTLTDSFIGLEMRKGQTYEAYAYFRKFPSEEPLPAEPFAILWYGDSTFDFPIFLNTLNE